jgi:hypothetical protein
MLHCAQYLAAPSNQILRCAQDDTPAAQDDNLEAASFDAQLVFFEEMDWGQARRAGASPIGANFSCPAPRAVSESHPGDETGSPRLGGVDCLSLLTTR